MTEAYPKEFIEKIRQQVKAGKPKYRVARELGIADNTFCHVWGCHVSGVTLRVL